MNSKFLAHWLNKYSKVTEWCSNCDGEVKLLNRFETQDCPNCGETIHPCSMCDMGIVRCSECVLGG